MPSDSVFFEDVNGNPVALGARVLWGNSGSGTVTGLLYQADRQSLLVRVDETGREEWFAPREVQANG